MSLQSVDFETRKACAQWARTVSLENPVTPLHVERLLLARRFIEAVAPSTTAQDNIMTNVVFLVRAFGGDDAVPADRLPTIIDMLLAIGAWS